MIINNSTDIPDYLIAVAYKFSLPENVHIDSVTLRNKKESIIHGNWGRYYVHERRITLTVPRDITHWRTYRKHIGEYLYVENKAEFLVMVMAHELRHAWQYQVSGWNKTKLSQTWIVEHDAEQYEQKQLDKFRAITSQLPAFAATGG